MSHVACASMEPCNKNIPITTHAPSRSQDLTHHPNTNRSSIFYYLSIKIKNVYDRERIALILTHETNLLLLLHVFCSASKPNTIVGPSSSHAKHVVAACRLLRSDHVRPSSSRIEHKINSLFLFSTFYFFCCSSISLFSMLYFSIAPLFFFSTFYFFVAPLFFFSIFYFPCHNIKFWISGFNISYLGVSLVVLWICYR